VSLKKKFRKWVRRSPALSRKLADWEADSYIRRRNRLYPECQWALAQRTPQKCVEASRCQIANRLFVLGGYITMETVSNRVDILDLDTLTWREAVSLPAGAAQTHVGTATDGESALYYISGQLGGNCGPVTPSCYALDLESLSWSELPSLPEGRYMPLVHFYEGRIHCLSGSKPDRSTPAHEHWSLAVVDGKAVETEWRREVDLPKPCTHTASCVIGDELYVFGGQIGDVKPVPGSSEYVCNFDVPPETVFDECYAFHLKTGEVRLLAPMLQALSHTEHAILLLGEKVLLAGGVIDRKTMHDGLYLYDLKADAWGRVGRLPYPMKSKVVAYWEGALYAVAGQKAFSDTDLRPYEVLDTVWCTKFSC